MLCNFRKVSIRVRGGLEALNPKCVLRSLISSNAVTAVVLSVLDHLCFRCLNNRWASRTP